jgi:hypothetical protein
VLSLNFSLFRLTCWTAVLTEILLPILLTSFTSQLVKTVEGQELSAECLRHPLVLAKKDMVWVLRG